MIPFKATGTVLKEENRKRKGGKTLHSQAEFKSQLQHFLCTLGKL